MIHELNRHAPAAVVAGLGTWLPPTVVTNDDLAAQLDTTDKWIRARTGIGQRHVIEPGTATSDLALEAGRRALASAGTTSAEAVVLATSTADRTCPASAPQVASRLGLEGVAAFDVAAVCTGFIYALATAAGLIGTRLAGSVLVIGADTFSTILDPHDRSTRAIFGDGAGAVLLRAGDRDEPGALIGFDLGSDGSGSDMIQVPAGGSRQRSTGTAADGDQYFQMEGRTVFLQAVLRMAESTRTVLKTVGWDSSNLDVLVAHQANQRILTAVAEQLDLRSEQVAVHLDRVGNTVAASIPLALADGVARGQITSGARVLLTGFGGGLTWGSAALRWPAITPITSP